MTIQELLEHPVSLLGRREVHFLIDSTHTISAMCDSLLPENHFFVVQDIKHKEGAEIMNNTEINDYISQAFEAVELECDLTLFRQGE